MSKNSPNSWKHVVWEVSFGTGCVKLNHAWKPSSRMSGHGSTSDERLPYLKLQGNACHGGAMAMARRGHDIAGGAERPPQGRRCTAR